MPRERPTHVRAWVLLAATLGAGLTLVMSATSLVEFAYRSVPLHVAVEVTATLTSIVAAQLVHGRFRSTLQLRDLVLFASLCGFAVTNLLFSALPALVSADPGHLHQVLANLVDNAIKYSPDGGEVKVQARGRGNLVEVRVSDTAPAGPDAARLVAADDRGDQVASLKPVAGARGRYVLIWITHLPRDGKTYRVGVSEMRLT